jgi:hypothetical protein
MQNGRMEQNSQVQGREHVREHVVACFQIGCFLGLLSLVWCFVSLTVCRHGDSSLSLGEVLSFWAFMCYGVFCTCCLCTSRGGRLHKNGRCDSARYLAASHTIWNTCPEHIPCDLM